MEHDKEQGYRVTIMDSLGTGEKTTSPYITNPEDVDTIIDNIARVSYTSNDNDRIVNDGQLAKRIFPQHIQVSADSAPANYRQSGTQCSLQCVKNLIAEASGADSASMPMNIDYPKVAGGGMAAADPIVSMNIANHFDPQQWSNDSREGLKIAGNTLKREADAITSSEPQTIDIGKYKELEAWANTQEPGTPLDENLLKEFFADFSTLLKTQENNKKAAGKAQKSSLYQAQALYKNSQPSIKDFTISCRPITSVNAAGAAQKCEHETFFLKDDTLKKELVIHLPTRGKKPDADLFEILQSISQAIIDLPEDKKPKHIHVSIGINGNDADQTEKRYHKAVKLIEGMKRLNGDAELPFSVKISGFE